MYLHRHSWPVFPGLWSRNLTCCSISEMKQARWFPQTSSFTGGNIRIAGSVPVMAESTDMQGIATFTETIATEVIMPLVPHGVPAYNWYFCIESDGYKTLIGTLSDVEPGATVEGNLILHRGESFPVCADYERLPDRPGTPVDAVEFSGGRAHGVYEVDAVAE